MMVLQMQDTSEEEEIERMFQVFDKDDDKFVCVGELKWATHSTLRHFLHALLKHAG